MSASTPRSRSWSFLAPRPQRRRLALLAIIAVLATVLATVVPPAGALGETISVGITQEDGTPNPPANTWDSDDTAGNDSGPSNGIVRTNDTLKYTVEVRVEDAVADNVTLTIVLARGTEATALPPFCGPGSSITPATLPPPAVPATLNGWTSLPQQTVVCNVGTRNPGSNLGYPIAARVRPEVPQGTVLDPVSAVITSDDPAATVVSDEVGATVSARPRFDVSKNAISLSPNGGYLGGGYLIDCPSDPAKRCVRYLASVLISTPNGGKGVAPLASPIVFTDNLTPDALYGAPNGYPVTTDPDYIAAGPNALQKYGAELLSCPATSVYTAPGHAIGGTLDATNAVRDSGTFTCTQPGGPGTPVTIAIANADTSAYTVPTTSYYPNGQALPANTGYVIAGRIDFAIPVDAVVDLGITDVNGSDLRWTNRYEDFEPVAVDGTVNDGSAQLPVNDSRAVNTQIRPRGSWSKAFLGVPGNPGNTPPAQFRPGWQVWEGPTNTTTYRSGDGILLPGQPVFSGIAMHNQSTSDSDVSFLVCDNWDNTKLQLAPDNYAGSATTRMQLIGSAGAPVWFHGYNDAAGYRTTGAGLPTLRVEYGTGPAGVTETCEDGDSPTGWASDPALVPGGVAAVSKVRIHTVIPPNLTTTGTYTTVAIPLVALAADPFTGVANPPGTILPNFASGKRLFGDLTMEEMLAAPGAWQLSTYDPAVPSGIRGDRMLMGSAVGRLSKEVWDAASSAWVTTVPTYGGNVDVDYRLQPSLTAGFATTATVPVLVEDCLPPEQSYVSGSATIAPTLIQLGAPAGSSLACPATNVYLRWDLGALPVGAAIAPIVYTAHVSATAPNGVETNNALITALGDPSDLADRSASAQIEIIQPVGVAIDKVALTPQVDINRSGEANLDPLVWAISFRNLDLPGALSDVDVIDVLPADGFGWSSYSGTTTFDSATVTSGTNVEILYTATPTASIDFDAAGATNDVVTGTTVWCDLPAGGAVVAGSGTPADCPATNADVTGLRIRRPGNFAPTDRFDVEISIIPEGNLEGDQYVNFAQGRAVGLGQPVGPVGSPEVIMSSSLGDRVWLDLNGNGIQDPAEPGLDGVTVSLWGVDDDGNPVGTVTAPLTTVTAGGGLYLFDELPAGTYNVGFDDSTLTATQRWTGQDVGADDADSDGDPSTGVVTGVVLGPNTDIDTVDQGVIELFDISGYSFYDAADDGSRAGDDPIGGVSITLTGTDNLGQPVTLTTMTNASGFYDFPDLPPGTYTITQDQSTVPTGYVDGQTVAGTDATATPNVIVVSLLDEDSVENNFGEIDPAIISGHVYVDADGDGVRSPAEDPIPGVTITLTGTDDQGNPVTLTTVTDSDGFYDFPDLRPGTYSVTETHPPDYFDGDDVAGSLGGTAGDDVIDTIVVAAGDDGTDYDFGEVEPVTGLTLTKLVEGDDAQTAPGVFVEPGSTITFTYIVANTGNLPVETIAIVDDQLGPITCPETVLAGGASMTCEVTDTAIAGPYVNIATVTGQPIDIFGDPTDPPIEVTDPANYFGVVPDLTIDKFVAGSDADEAPGPFLTVGDPVSFTYVINNPGNVDLTGIALVDDVLGPITCPRTTLVAGDSMTCAAAAIVTAGPYVNTGTVTGQPTLPDGTAYGPVLTADDPANYHGQDRGIRITKRVNRADADVGPGPGVTPGDPVTFTYIVFNTGNVRLDDVTVVDDVLGPIDCPRTRIVAGGQMTCVATATATAGNYVNVGTATGQPIDPAGNPSGPPIQATNPAHYYGVDPAISIVKSVAGDDANAAPGPNLPAGEEIRFTYVVTNTGNVVLDDVTVDDDVIGRIECPNSSLAPDETMTCVVDVVATAGDYVNVGTVTAQPIDPGTGSPFGDVVDADDPAHYFGDDPGISIVKSVNGDDANTAPGPSVLVGEDLTFTYVVTNVGNVDLDGVTVTDDVLGAITCPATALAVGATMTCTRMSKATVGQVTNTGTASARQATSVDDPGVVSVTAIDTATYTSRAVRRTSLTDTLAFTGTATFQIISLGLVLLAAGATVLLGRRRLAVDETPPGVEDT